MKKFFLIFAVFLLSEFTGLFAQVQEESVETEEVIPQEKVQDIPQEIIFLEAVSKKELSTAGNRANLVIECNLPSASVYLNRVYQGKTRLTVKDLLPSDYILEVRKNGCKNQIYYISAKAGYSLTYKVILESQ